MSVAEVEDADGYLEVQEGEIVATEVERPGTTRAAVVRTGFTVPLPFYRYSKHAVRIDGEQRSEGASRAVVFPIWFLAGAALYWFFLLRPRGEGRRGGALSP